MPAPAVLLAQLAARPPQHRASTDAASSEYRYDVDDYYGNWARRLSGAAVALRGGAAAATTRTTSSRAACKSWTATALVSALSAYVNEEMEEPPDSWDVHLVTDFSTVFEALPHERGPQQVGRLAEHHLRQDVQGRASNFNANRTASTTSNPSPRPQRRGGAAFADCRNADDRPTTSSSLPRACAAARRGGAAPSAPPRRRRRTWRWRRRRRAPTRGASTTGCGGRRRARPPRRPGGGGGGGGRRERRRREPRAWEGTCGSNS